ncbi:hypothetical protein [Pontibacter roseus]|uniref:hypothetical protein n=1 Tax=Pontibacter roseus TaxID=336989 RepID=UPI000376EE6B|nr:hypothetical protein [Pontibacter roseus]
MKNLYKLLSTILILVFTGPLYAQSTGVVMVRKKGISFAYYLNGQQLDKNGLHYVLQSNAAANDALRLSQRNAIPAKTLAFAGSFLVGYSAGTHLVGSKPNWALAGAGAGFVALSFPFWRAKMRQEQRAVYLYNSQTPPAIAKKKLLYQLDYAPTGAKLSLTF